MIDKLVSAPGKVMISGEYAVLHGAEAVVAAVNRRVYARFESGKNALSLPPEAALSRRVAESALGQVPFSLWVDLSQLRSPHHKFGLGSSAAAAAVAAASIHAYHGHDITNPRIRLSVLEKALEGHHAVSPRGSGADVAAATLGGVIRFRKYQESVKTASIEWPSRLEYRVVWSGVEARTAVLLDRVKTLQNRFPDKHGELMQRLTSLAQQFIEAMIGGTPDAILDATEKYADGMDQLGQAAHAPILNGELRAILALARKAGGAAKPSGAGGGDIALALFTDSGAVERFESSCQKEGFEVLSLCLGAQGVEISEPHHLYQSKV